MDKMNQMIKSWRHWRWSPWTTLAWALFDQDDEDSISLNGIDSFCLYPTYWLKIFARKDVVSVWKPFLEPLLKSSFFENVF